MKNSKRTLSERLSPEDILASMRDWYRFSEALAGAEPGFELTFDTTVVQWMDALEVVSTAELGHRLNEIYHINGFESEWEFVLEYKNTLRDLCNFVSKKGAARASCSGMVLAGHDCAAAGVFVALRSMLSASGVPVVNARPSTPLNPLLTSSFGSIITAASLLAPGALPLPICRLEERFPKYRRVLLAVLVAIPLGTTMVAGFNYTMLAFAFALWADIFIYKLLEKLAGSPTHYFKDINTLADVTRLILSHQQRASQS
jgi:hypothetical protein